MHETTSKNWIFYVNCLVLAQPSIGIFGHSAAGYTPADEFNVSTVET